MGMGEPMMNLDAVLGACERLPDIGITHRRTAISTVGWIPGIEALTAQEMPIRLALSLHAADEALRSELMPVNDRYPLADVLEACVEHYERRRRRVFVEYVMLAGVNDSHLQAKQLAQALDPRVFKVNLIPYNPTDSPYRGSSPKAIDAFKLRARAPRHRRHGAPDPRARHRRGLRAARRPRVTPAPTAREHDQRALIAERLTAQLLAGAPAGDPLAVAERLLAIQGQDPRGARLAIRARSAGVSAADIDRALTEERSLLITWLNRGTLHLIRSEDYPLLHALTTPQLLTGSARRLAQEGVEPKLADRALAVIERAIAADGPLTRHQLRERLQSAGIPTGGQAFIHLIPSVAARPDRPRADGRSRARLRACPRTGCRHGRHRATWRWPSWPGATSRGHGPAPTATWRAGRRCRCATPGRPVGDRR